MSANNILTAILAKDRSAARAAFARVVHERVLASIQAKKPEVVSQLFNHRIAEDVEVDAALLEYEVVRGSDGGYYDDEGNRFGGNARGRYGKQKAYNLLATYDKMTKPSYGAPADPNAPHEVHINGRLWKTFQTKAHADKVKASMEANPVHKGKRVEIRPAR